VIEVENAGRWAGGARYDKVATLLIGMVAILAATFAIQQAHFGLAGQRAQIMAGRLSTDAATKVATASAVSGALLGAQQQALLVGMGGVSRQMAGTTNGDDTFVAIGGAEVTASEDLRALLDATSATSGKAPLDPYTAGLVTADNAGLAIEVMEQNRQVDLSEYMSGREQLAVLGLSLATLAGVLAGVAAVLRRGRAGWAMLAVGWSVVAIAVVVAVAALV
jgi:hypothetical protein